MREYIDVHHHLMFGMDDGAKDAEAAQKMLDAIQAQGIKHVFATPHAYPGIKRFDRGEYEKRLQVLNEYCVSREYGIRIYSGAEIRYSQAMTRCLERAEIPTMNGTRFVLTEWEELADSELICQAVREISNTGYIVIMAHIERYRNLRKKIELIEKLKADFQMRIQIDCEALLDRRIGMIRTRRFSHAMIERGLVDYVATDAHDVSLRRARMDETYLYLKDNFGKDCADALTWQNPLELIKASSER